MVILTLKPSTKIVTSTFIEWPTKLTLTRPGAQCLFAWLLSLWGLSRRRCKSENNLKNVFSASFILQSDSVFTIYSQIRQSVFAPICSMYINSKKKITTTKKQQIIQSLKVGRHIFWTGEIAFLALMQLPWPCTGTPFFAALGTNWQMRGLRRAVPRVVLCRTRS